MTSRADWRLQSETFTIHLTGGTVDGTVVKHRIDVTLSHLDNRVHDLIFVGRGKIGQGIDLMFTDLGIQLSRILQGRDPEEAGTGMLPTSQ